jgi:hypothetical protein
MNLHRGVQVCSSTTLTQRSGVHSSAEPPVQLLLFLPHIAAAASAAVVLLMLLLTKEWGDDRHQCDQDDKQQLYPNRKPHAHLSTAELVTASSLLDALTAVLLLLFLLAAAFSAIVSVYCCCYFSSEPLLLLPFLLQFCSPKNGMTIATRVTKMTYSSRTPKVMGMLSSAPPRACLMRVSIRLYTGMVTTAGLSKKQSRNTVTPTIAKLTCSLYCMETSSNQVAHRNNQHFSMQTQPSSSI